MNSLKSIFARMTNRALRSEPLLLGGTTA